MKFIRFTAIAVIFALMLTVLGCKPAEPADGTTASASGDSPPTSLSPTSGGAAMPSDLPELSAKGIADAVLAAYDASPLPAMKLTYHGAEEGSASYFEPELSGWIINGKRETDPIMDLLADYAFYTPIGHYGFEVDILRVKDAVNLPEATEYLQARKKQKIANDVGTYNADDLPMVKNAKIFTIGSYAVLLANNDTALAEKIITDLFEGKAQLSSSPATSEPTTAQTPAETNAPLDEVVQIQSVTNFDFSMLDPEPKKNLPLDEITRIPAITVRKYSRNTMFLLGGNCEAGAVIHVRGGTEEINARSDDGDWLVEVPIDPENLSVLFMSATVPGKAQSDEVKFIVRPQTDITMYEDSGIYAVVVGNDYFSWFDDCVPNYVGSDLLNDKGIEDLKKRYARKITDLRGKGLNTEIIVLMIPSPMRLYADKVPSYLKMNTGETLTDQFNTARREVGVTVVDLRDVMNAHKNDPFKIFHRTDSHWSDYGAYFGYVELMNHIALKFPDAAPRPVSDFEFYNKKVDFGDIYHTLGLGRTVLKEYSVFVNFKFEPPGGFRNLYNGDSVVIDHNVTSADQVTNTNLTTGTFPKAYVMRDSFCGPIFNYMTDRFDTITWQGMWNYNFNIKEIAEAKPDYLIYIINERNIKNIMYE